MRRIGAGAVLAMAVLGSCVKVPPFRGDAGPTVDAPIAMPDATPCGVGTADADCDGWPTTGAAIDCDDANVDLNPGVVDDLAGNGISVDCLADVQTQLASATVVGSSVVTGPYTMGFPPAGAAVRLPDSMQTHGATPVELLHLEPGGGCVGDEEHALGYSLYPTLNANPLSTMGTRTNQWNAEGGRAMAHVRVELTSSPPCGTTARLDARIDLTVFPDGRLVRHDAVTVNETIVASSCTNPCGGPQPTSFYFTTFYGFADAAFDRYQIEAGTWETSPVSADIMSGTAHPWHCFGSSTGLYRVGTTWAGSDGASRFRRPRFAVSVLDFVRGPTIAAQTYHARSALFFYTTGAAEDQCTIEMPSLADSYRIPANLGPNVMDPDTGIYMITVESSNQITFGPQRVVIENVTLPAGSALDIPIASDKGVTVWLGATRIQANADYQVQRGAAGRYVLWLPNALAPSDVLTILGPGGTL